jgi:hypothetical protein
MVRVYVAEEDALASVPQPQFNGLSGAASIQSFVVSTGFPRLCDREPRFDGLAKDAGCWCQRSGVRVACRMSVD